MKHKISILTIILLIISTTAKGESRTFGFAASNPINGNIAQGYEGFNWLGVNGTRTWINNTGDTLDPLLNGTLGSAWNNGGGGESMQLASVGTFTLNSIDLATNTFKYGGPANKPITIEGWKNGSVVDTFITPIIDGNPNFTTVVLNWSGIDEVSLNYNYAGPNLFVTNISVDTTPAPVPLPPSIAMFASGLLGLGTLCRKRIKRNFTQAGITANV